MLLAAVLTCFVCVVPASVFASTAPGPPALSEPSAPLTVAAPPGGVRYTPGRGLQLEKLGLSVGGFTKVELDRFESTPARLGLDDLNFILVLNRFERFRVLSELGLNDLAMIQGNGDSGSGASFNLVRLFGDVYFSDLFKFRLGTFLTPVGRWNVINAPPLTWTASQPLITNQAAFDPTTTGAMLFGSMNAGQGRLGYSVFARLVKPVKEEPEFKPADNSAGGRVDYSLAPGRGVGATYLASQRAGRWTHLGGLDGEWRLGRTEFLGEFLFEDGPRVESQWGVYLQSAVPVWREIYLLGRYEHYAARSPSPEVNLFTAGLAYRPFSFMTLEIEYLFADQASADEPPGFRSSFSTLF